MFCLKHLAQWTFFFFVFLSLANQIERIESTDKPLEISSDNEINPVPITEDENKMLFIYHAANMKRWHRQQKIFKVCGTIRCYILSYKVFITNVFYGFTNINYQIFAVITAQEEIIPMLTKVLQTIKDAYCIFSKKGSCCLFNFGTLSSNS